MFEYQHKPSFFAKALTLCAIGMGVGFGSCGLAYLAGGGGMASGLFADVSGVLAILGALLFFTSLVGVVVTIILKFVQILLK